MSLTSKVEIPKRTLVLFFIVDTSGGMAGNKIAAINTAIRELIPEIKEISDGNADAEIKIAVLEFSTGAQWITPVPVEVSQFKWTNLDAAGARDLGAAYCALNEKFSIKGFMDKERSFAPVLFLLSDGPSTDDWERALGELKKNQWFKAAIKIALAIGANANLDELSEFTGNMETVLEAHNVSQLMKMIKFVDIKFEIDERIQDKQDKLNQQQMLLQVHTEMAPDDNDCGDDWEETPTNTPDSSTGFNVLPQGYTIKTKNLKTVVVDQKLGEGGQGTVYRADYDGQPKALKWYSGKKFKDPKKFYTNLENTIRNGKPTNAFLWPEDITEYDSQAFGYITDLRSDEYKDFFSFQIGKEKFVSITAWVNAAMHICAGLHALHLKGYCYQDLSDGNFLINPQNGNVLFCDHDNVTEFGKSSSMFKARYAAPEIVAKGEKPNDKTDLFSLAVVLFLLWTQTHPLEGKSAHPVCMTDKEEKRIFGTNPVFIWDPTDNSNRPVQGIHQGAIVLWPLLPVYLRDAFIRAFSNKLMTDPPKRIIEQEWLHIFIRMRGEIYKCSCDYVYFADPVAQNPCPNCNNANVFLYIKTKKYNVPVHQRTKLYSCHIEKDSDDFATLGGEVTVNGDEFILKNVSGKNWTVTNDNNTFQVVPNTTFTLKKNMMIDFGQTSAEVI